MTTTTSREIERLRTERFANMPTACRSEKHALQTVAGWLRKDAGNEEELAQFGVFGDANCELRTNPKRIANEQRAQGGREYLTPGDAVFSRIFRSMTNHDTVLSLATVVEGEPNYALRVAATDDIANTGALLAENGENTELDIDLTVLRLTSYKYVSRLVRFSMELDQDGPTFAENLLDILGARIGKITNQHFTTGTGSGQPRGLTLDAVNSGVTAAAAVPTANELMDLRYSVDSSYHDAPTCGFMMHPTIWLAIAKASTAANQPYAIHMPSRVMLPLGPSAATSLVLHGSPVWLNPALPTAAASKGVLYGDFSKYVSRIDSDMSLLRFSERWAENLMIGWAATLRADGGLADVNAVKYMTLG